MSGCLQLDKISVEKAGMLLPFVAENLKRMGAVKCEPVGSTKRLDKPKLGDLDFICLVRDREAFIKKALKRYGGEKQMFGASVDYNGVQLDLMVTEMPSIHNWHKFYYNFQGHEALQYVRHYAHEKGYSFTLVGLKKKNANGTRLITRSPKVAVKKLGIPNVLNDKSLKGVREMVKAKATRVQYDRVYRAVRKEMARVRMVKELRNYATKIS